ncbi:MAG: carbon-nitrogen hydrolase family protein [Leptolyngbyaceae cyanobacterium MO_188.B28]|nr:carbon-nitrogen hydrolase family protein [Leptolyngbyaceae cyanobacterium MO_188.B28]
MGDVFPTVKAAVVQAASILYDREKTLDKAVALIEEAAGQGAELVTFSESFLPGYPYHIWLGAPEWYHGLFKEWFLNGVEVPSKTTNVLCETARANTIDVVMGVNERDGNTCYNTLLFIDRQGQLLGKHRKIMPTHAERTCWGMGDGANIRTWNFSRYRLSGLICWEHTMDLARHALIAQRPQIHVASWFGGSAAWYPKTDKFNLASELAARYHALVGECFVLNAQGTLDREGYEKLCETDYQRQFLREGGGWSAIVAPGGEYLAEPLKDQEGILYAELDFNAIADMAHWYDASGHYARPDLLSLWVNTEAYQVLESMTKLTTTQFKSLATNGNEQI